MAATFLPSGYALLSAVAALQAPPSDPQADPAPPPPESQEIVVTGTRIQSPNRKSASPVESVRAEDFTMTGVPNVEQTLNQLPQLSPSFTSTSNNPGTGAATLDLRGLGSVRTLILVNGRRWIANDAGQIPEVDVNTIPSALIDRVDIVTGGASAVYGSDAVTGVINFVLKKKIEGLHLELRNNLTELGDARSSSADLSFGTGFSGGRGNLLASVGYLNQAPVFQGARDFSRFALGDNCTIAATRNELGVSQPSLNFNCDAPGEEVGLIHSGSGTIPQSRIRAPLFLPTGVGSRLRRSQTRFAPGGSIVPFVFALDAYNFAPDNYLQVPLERWSGNLIGSLEVSDRFKPYVELSYIRTLSPQQLAPAPATIGTGSDSVASVQLNLDNPFLSAQGRQALDISFGRDSAGRRGFIGNPVTGFSLNPAYTGDADGLVTLSGPFTSRLTGLGPRQASNRRDAYRGLIGARGDIGKNWRYDLYYSQSYVAHDIAFANSASARRLQQALLARRDASGNIACIDPSNGCVPINIFGQQDISPAAADFLRIDPLETTRVREQVAEATVNGEFGKLPGGPVRVALGANWRKTSYVFTPDESFEDGDTLGFLASTGAAGKTQVAELFGEALLPFLEGRPWAEELSAELGLRYSNYDSVGGVWTWKAMGNWSPMSGLRFRAGVQRATRAPNVRELFEQANDTDSRAFDPCAPIYGFALNAELAASCARNGAANLPADFTFAIVRTEGSQELKAETARTITLGAVVQPVRWLSIALDYYDINIKEAIGVFGGGANFIVTGCILGGADPADPLCQAYQRGPDGFVSFVYAPTANLARLRTRGIDWQVNANRTLGKNRLHLGLSGTRLLGSTVQFNPNLAAVECAGSFSGACGNTIQGTATPRWKLFNRASWQRGPITLSLRHRYFSSTRNGIFALREAFDQPAPTNIPVHAEKLQARHYFDASVAFDIGSQFDLTLGVNNLTDARPSLVGLSQIQANTDPSLYDVLGRRFFVSVKAKFE